MRYSQNKLCNVLAFGFGIFFIYPGKLIVQLLCMLQLHATFELKFAQAPTLQRSSIERGWWWRRGRRCWTATTTWCTINRQDVHSYLFSHFKCLVFAWENRHFPQLYLREIRIRQKKHNLIVLEIDCLLPCTIWIICKFAQKIWKSFQLLIPPAEVNVSHPSHSLSLITGYASTKCSCIRLGKLEHVASAQFGGRPGLVELRQERH